MTNLQIGNPAVADLPPSGKLVYLVLQESGPTTQQQLAAQHICRAEQYNSRLIGWSHTNSSNLNLTLAMLGALFTI